LRSAGRQGSAAADQLIEFGYDNHGHEAILKYAKKIFSPGETGL
jgi:hypothetical protein